MSLFRFPALLVVCLLLSLAARAPAQCGVLLQDEVPPSDAAAYRTLFEWDFDGPGPLEPELLVGGNYGRIHAFNGTRWRQVGARLSGPNWDQFSTDPHIAQFVGFRGELYALASVRLSSLTNHSRLYRWTGTQWLEISNTGSSCTPYGVFGWWAGATVWDDKIIVVGRDLYCGHTPTMALAWDGTSWSTVGNLYTDRHRDATATSVFATSQNRLLMAGHISTPGGTAVIAELIDGLWVTKATGISASNIAYSSMQEIDGKIIALIRASTVNGQGSSPVGVLEENQETGQWTAWQIPTGSTGWLSGSQIAKVEDTWYLAASVGSYSEVGMIFRRQGDGPWTRCTQFGGYPKFMRGIAFYKNSLIAIGENGCEWSSKVYQSDLTEPVAFYALSSRFVGSQHGFTKVLDTYEGLLGCNANFYTESMSASRTPQIVMSETCNSGLSSFAYFDGTDWRNSSEPLVGGIRSLLQYQNQILAFGSFDRVVQGDIPPYVARWTDGRWESFPVGLPSAAHSAVIHQGQLYATTTAFLSTNTLRFNDTQWVTAAQSLQMQDAVLMSNGTTLYAFRTPYLYRLVGDLWVNVNPPIGLNCDLATVFNGVLYAAFSGGGISTVKRLENNQWIDVGSFPNLAVIASLAWHDGVLYAGLGNSGGSSMAPLMALRNGIWERAIPNSPPRAGVQHPPITIKDLHSSGDILHLVGKFTYIGGLTAESWIRFYTGAPRILTQTVAAEVTAGQTAYFSIEPEVYHDPLQTYQWHRNGVAVSNGLTSTGSTIAGATTPYLRITNVSAADLGQYTVKITNGCGVTESNPGELRFPPPYCPADFDQDGSVTGTDVEAFFLTWEIGTPDAEINLDGGTDGTDIQAFFTLWEAGGC